MKPPRDKCDLCGRNLYQVDRYRLVLYKRIDDTLIRLSDKDTVLCIDCLRHVKKWAKKQGINTRYKKMPTLGVPKGKYISELSRLLYEIAGE